MIAQTTPVIIRVSPIRYEGMVAYVDVTRDETGVCVTLDAPRPCLNEDRLYHPYNEEPVFGPVDPSDTVWHRRMFSQSLDDAIAEAVDALVSAQDQQDRGYTITHDAAPELPPIGGGSQENDDTAATLPAPSAAFKAKMQRTRATSQKRDNQRAARSAIDEAYRANATQQAADIADTLTDLGFVVGPVHDVDGTPVQHWYGDQAIIKQTPYTLKIYNGRPGKFRNGRLVGLPKKADAELVNRVEHGWCARGEWTGYAAGVAAALLTLIETPDPLMAAQDAMEAAHAAAPEPEPDARPVDWFINYMTERALSLDDLRLIVETQTPDTEDRANMIDAARTLIDRAERDADAIMDSEPFSDYQVSTVNAAGDVHPVTVSHDGPWQEIAGSAYTVTDDSGRPVEFSSFMHADTLSDEPANAYTLATPSPEGGLQTIMAVSRHDLYAPISGGSHDLTECPDCGRQTCYGLPCDCREPDATLAPLDAPMCEECGVSRLDTDLRDGLCWECDARRQRETAVQLAPYAEENTVSTTRAAHPTTFQVYRLAADGTIDTKIASKITTRDDARAIAREYANANNCDTWIYEHRLMQDISSEVIHPTTCDHPRQEPRQEPRHRFCPDCGHDRYPNAPRPVTTGTQHGPALPACSICDREHEPRNLYTCEECGALVCGLHSVRMGGRLLCKPCHTSDRRPVAMCERCDTYPAMQNGFCQHCQPTGESVTITHTAEDGTLATGDTKPQSAVFKMCGWKWSRNLSAWYLPNSRDKRPQTLKINRTAQALRDNHAAVILDIDERAADPATAEANRAARLADRQAALHAKAEKLNAKGHEYGNAADAICARFEMGQPILVGHHSEKRARKDHDRMWSNLSKATETLNASDEAARKAEASEKQQRRRLTAPATMRRIAKLEAERRDLQRRADRGQVDTIGGATIAELLDENAATIQYWRDHLATLEAAGVKVWGPDDFTKGDYARSRFGMHEVVRVNRKSLTVKNLYGFSVNTGALTWDDVRGKLSDEEAEALRIAETA